MKALSLTQPWAWLVINGGKDVENRKWNTRFRGEFLIHAAKTTSYFELVAARLAQGNVTGYASTIPETPLPMGGIVGRAKLVAVRSPSENRGAWSAAGQHGFVLEDVRPTPFVPCRGALNFWEVPEDVLAELNAAEGRR